MGKVEVSPKGRNRLLGGHPWVFRSDIVAAEQVDPGDVVDVVDNKAVFLGRALYNPKSQITLRLLTPHDEPINRDFFARRIQRAWEYRLKLADPNSCRVVHSESDFLAALIVDKFSDVLVTQCLSLGMERYKSILCELFMEIIHPAGIFERDDGPTRKLEGMDERVGVLCGSVPDTISMVENGIKLWIDVVHGQKTGYFLDQKENRAALAPYVQNARVLDCFCRVGAFSLHAAHYGARETLGIDISESTIDWAQKNAQTNGLTEKCTFRVENAFDALRAMEQKQERFDVVVLDPPAFTKSRSTVQSATRGYKDINLRGMRLLQDGGFLVTCSCSQHMLPNMFLDVVQDAAKDAKRTLRLIEQRTQAKDHPILAGMPESNYLKRNIYQVYHR